MRKRAAALAATAVLSLALTGCGGSTTSKSSGKVTNVNPSGAIKARQISWLLSRPANGTTITTMKKIAAEYAQGHPGFSLNFITTPDRPSYIQKYETLAAANKLPELFDTDATPFAQKLAKQGRMVNVETLLKDFGLYNSYRPNALAYQRFDDGSLYMIPLEYGIEVFWYNKALFKKAGVSVPTSLDDIPSTCHSLRKAGITPIAMDGQDQWPLQRWITYQPFRVAGPDYIRKLKRGQAKLSDAPGQKAVNWLSQLGTNKCFQTGFSATGYADAENLLTAGKAAMYNMGTWELPALATSKLPASIRKDVDFFTLPTVKGSVTSSNEYVAPSGIGMAVNAKTYDPLMRDFLKYALTKYSQEYAATGALAPTTNVKTAIPSNATPLYAKAINQAKNVGSATVMPWDTQLDPTSNTLMQQELVLLLQGNASPKKFTSTIDDAIAQNAPKYFK